MTDTTKYAHNPKRVERELRAKLIEQQAEIERLKVENEKQDVKKPTSLELSEADLILLPEQYKTAEKKRCEQCGFVEIFIDRHITQWKYCPRCGQRTDWGGE